VEALHTALDPRDLAVPTGAKSLRGAHTHAGGLPAPGPATVARVVGGVGQDEVEEADVDALFEDSDAEQGGAADQRGAVTSDSEGEAGPKRRRVLRRLRHASAALDDATPAEAVAPTELEDF